MKKFVDLHLRPPINNLGQVERMVKQSSDLGYRSVGMSLPPNIKREETHQLKTICEDIGVDLVTRIDLVPRTSNELLRNLRRFRRKFEVISVTCNSKSVARQAAKDRRVDLLVFSSGFSRKRFFDNAEAELASRAEGALEIDMASLLHLTGFPRIRLLSNLRKEVAIAEKFKVPIVISSGATDVGLLRRSYDYAALATLFDLHMSLALRGLSENPLGIIERNRKKLSAGHVAPGLFVVRDVKRCLDA
jgi:RNase P/RNase MRP subunit p30